MERGASEILAALLNLLKKREEAVMMAPLCNVLVFSLDTPLGIVKRRLVLHFDGRCYRVLLVEAGLRGIRGLRGLRLCLE